MKDCEIEERLRSQILELVAEYASVEHAEKQFDVEHSRVPVSGRVFDSRELISLTEAVLEFWLTSGRFNDEFEKGLKNFLGAKHVLTVNSGSSANLLALSALTSHLLKRRALKPGDEVITCATGFPTTVNPILLYGMTPVFIDSVIPTYNIDVEVIEDAITSKTKAIMLAHTLGNPFDLDAVLEIVRKYDLFLIEDNCDALGTRYRGRITGSFGDVGTLSFYPAHHISTGEGGAVFTNSGLVRRALESMRDWGRDCYCPPGVDNSCGKRFGWQSGDLPEGFDHKYTYSHLGFNLKSTDLQAAIGVEQLKKLEKFISKRKSNFQFLYKHLKEFEEFMILPEPTEYSDPSWFGFPITIRPNCPIGRRRILDHLDDRRVETRMLFGGNLIRQPYMKSRPYRVVGDLSSADLITENSFWIGVYPGLSELHLSYVVDVFREIFRQ